MIVLMRSFSRCMATACFIGTFVPSITTNGKKLNKKKIAKAYETPRKALKTDNTLRVKPCSLSQLDAQARALTLLFPTHHSSSTVVPLSLSLSLALLPALEKVGNIGASALGELSVLATANTVEVVGKVEVVEQRVAIDGELDRRPCFALLNLLGRLYSTAD